MRILCTNSFISGRTTANLNKHLFWNGFYAYGTKSKKHYYGTEVTYSLNAKKNVPFEFPQRNIIFETGYDVMSPADKFLIHNKDNMFMSLRTQKVEQMYFYNRQKLSFVYETDWGLSFHTSLKAESNEPTVGIETVPEEVLVLVCRALPPTSHPTARNM